MTPNTKQDRVHAAIKRGLVTVHSIANYTHLPLTQVRFAINTLRANGEVVGTMDQLKVSNPCLLAQVWR